VAIITGAGRGIGRAMTLGLLSVGIRVLAVDRDREPLDELSDLAAQRQAGARLETMQADLTHEPVIADILAATLKRFGRVDILVNNAGIQRRTPSENFPLSDWDEVMAINLRAVFVYCQTFGRHFLAQGGGKIINIASVQSLIGGWTIPAYTASKHGLAGLTKTLCNEWAGRGININCIAPGYMDTEMNTALKADPQRSRSINERIPAGRWGQPEDLAGAAVFLASPAASYINGHVLVVDGGWMAR